MPFDFFGLPAELRNRIYQAGLVPPGGFDPTKPDQEPPATGLLAASRRARGEAEQLYWRFNTFTFDNLELEDILAGCPEASRWLVAVGSGRMRHIGMVRISYRDRFTLVLGHETFKGKPTLVLKELTMATDKDWTPEQPHPSLNPNPKLAIPYDDSHIRASISFALNQLFDYTDINLASFYGHNLVGGLAQFLLYCDHNENWWYHDFYSNALQFITGSTTLEMTGPPTSDHFLRSVSKRHENEEREYQVRHATEMAFAKKVRVGLAREKEFADD